MKRWIVGIGLALLSAVILVGGFFLWQIGPRNVWGMLRYDQRRDGHLVAGDRAPDLVLTELDGKTQARLADHIGQMPAVLIFGSFT